jgi:hypothetical protein
MAQASYQRVLFADVTEANKRIVPWDVLGAGAFPAQGG